MAISQGTVLDNVALAWSTVNPSAGDLFIMFFYNDGGDDQGTGPGTITRFDTDVGTSMEAGAYWYECTGSETGNVFTSEADFNSMGNEGYNAHWFLVPAAEWHGTTSPEHAKANSSTGTVDPPSLTPSGWAADEEDTIWIICGGRDDDDGISAVSSGYSTNEQLTENVNQVEVGSGYRTAATATENPGTYTQTGTAEEWVAYTVAVRPAAAAGPVNVDVPLATLVLTGLVPTVVASDHQTVDVPLATLTLTGHVPTVVASDHQTVDVPTGTLTLTGYAPTVDVTEHVNVDVPAGTLTLTGYAPTVEVTAHVNIDVPIANLILTGYAPTVDAGAGITIEVPVANLILTAYSPTITVSDHVSIEVPTGNLILIGYAPTVIGLTGVNIEVPTASLLLTSHAPIATLTENVFVDVPVGELALSGYIPTVTTIEDVEEVEGPWVTHKVWKGEAPGERRRGAGPFAVWNERRRGND